eukprot:6470894-Amphidinium_carterae.2
MGRIELLLLVCCARADTENSYDVHAQEFQEPKFLDGKKASPSPGIAPLSVVYDAPSTGVATEPTVCIWSYLHLQY